jgi:uncharacterized protein (DUF1786 family)
VETSPNQFNKILAIDIGQGTQDILLYDSNKNIENCISLILPSPTTIYAHSINGCQKDLYIYGSTIGGGKLSGAIINHIRKGFAVFMEPEAAASIRDDLERVQKLGILVGKPPEQFSGMTLELTEVTLPLLKNFFAHFAEDMNIDAVAVAVQDHGTAGDGTSDRVFRFAVMADRLMKDNAPVSFAYWANEVPACFTRMLSLVKSVRKAFDGTVLVMDTAFCAVLGCVEEYPEPYLIINAGNDHTLCVIVSRGRIDALMEHHTGMLTPEKLRHIISAFASGELTNQEIFDDGGHGSLYINNYSVSLKRIIVTGPNREKVRQTGLPVTFAAPGGSMMLTGPIGLVKACQHKSH